MTIFHNRLFIGQVVKTSLQVSRNSFTTRINTYVHVQGVSETKVLFLWPITTQTRRVGNFFVDRSQIDPSSQPFSNISVFIWLEWSGFVEVSVSMKYLLGYRGLTSCELVTQYLILKLNLPKHILRIVTRGIRKWCHAGCPSYLQILKIIYKFI